MKKRDVNFIYLLLVIFTSCSQKQQDVNIKFKQKYETDYFCLAIPNNWIVKKANTIDSYSLVYFISENDTIIQDISCYASSLTESEPIIKPKSAEFAIDSIAKIENQMIFVSDTELIRGLDIDKYRKQNVTYKTLTNGYELKITSPRKSGVGITGFYCDSIGNDKTIGRIKVNMYGKNLNVVTEKDLLEIINNIEFKKQ